MSTRLLIGAYWTFTIIITSCYTGSIIAFVTLPPTIETIDSVEDIQGSFYRTVTLGKSVLIFVITLLYIHNLLDSGGWKSWFVNSTHAATAKLFKKMEYVSSLEEGIANVTDSFFWNYAYLGSRAQLHYLIKSNFSDE